MSRIRRHHQGVSLHRWQKIKNHAGAQDALQDGNTGEPFPQDQQQKETCLNKNPIYSSVSVYL